MMFDASGPEAYLVPTVLSIVTLAMSAAATVHVVLRKRDTRAAIGWIGLIWLSPVLGVVLYVLLGINRINRKARALRKDQPRARPMRSPHECPPGGLGAEMRSLESLSRLVGAITERPLWVGNSVEPLSGKTAAYPAMLAAIEGAEKSIAMSSYIFNDDPAGRMFVEALERAVGRGVAVRVLVDDLGARYDLPTIFGVLRRAGVPSASFLPTLVPGFFPYLNLRNHRKVLVVDGAEGFTGGLNIDKDYDPSLKPRAPKHDIHFRLKGPVVADLMACFADDWVFAADELLEGEAWFPELTPVGPVRARGVAAGPDQAEDRIRLTILGALAAAERSVMIRTPYFLPDDSILSALYVAAKRGVMIDLILPSQNNLQLVHWASRSVLPELLEGGVRVSYAPPPFDHSKLMIVDRAWTFLGSANWDSRSLRLNFEFNVECYDEDLASGLALAFEQVRAGSTLLTAEALRSSPFLFRLRDGLARLLSPYL